MGGGISIAGFMYMYKLPTGVVVLEQVSSPCCFSLPIHDNHVFTSSLRPYYEKQYMYKYNYSLIKDFCVDATRVFPYPCKK